MLNVPLVCCRIAELMAVVSLHSFCPVEINVFNVILFVSGF